MHSTHHCQILMAVGTRQSNQRLWRIMKISAFLFAACLQAAVASTAQTVSLSVQNASLEGIFNEIYEQTGVAFLYNSQMLARAKPVSLEVANIDLEEALELAFKNQPLTYIINNNTIVIRQKSLPKEGKEEIGKSEKSLADRIVSGKITDENGEPLAGATIWVKGTRLGRETDLNGNYHFTIPDGILTDLQGEGEVVIQISYVGYVTQEIPIGNSTIIDVSMTADLEALKEVQVVSTGYYEIEERINPGNIAKIDAKIIEQQPVNNPLQALQGRLAGVIVNQNSGLPGDAFDINIRGLNNISGNNRPFFIIDGVPYPNAPITNQVITRSLQAVNPFFSLNPKDIQSIEILKDADATAIYGSRGANGVVIIKTKRAASTDSQLNLDVSFGFSEVPEKVELLNTEQHLLIRNEALSNEGFDEIPSFIEFLFPDLVVWDPENQTDWQEELIGGRASFSNYNVSYSGGGTKTVFRIGSSYSRESTIFPTDLVNDRISFNGNINHLSSNSKLKIDFSTSFTNAVINIPETDLTPLALKLAPNAPDLYDSLGNLNWEESTWENPLAILEKSYEAVQRSLISNINLSYLILDDLSVGANIGYTNLNTQQQVLVPTTAFDPAIRSSLSPRSTSSDGDNETWIIEPQLNYSNEISSGNIDAMVGLTLQRNLNNTVSLDATDFASNVLIEDISSASNLSVLSSGESDYKYSAVYARFSYNYRDKYILNLTGRRDVSSRFGPDNRFGNFGAVGFAWLFSNESFLNSLSFLNFGKLRLSYGITGSDQSQNYQYLATYTSTKFPYQGNTGLIPSRLANPDFGWESVKKLEGGLEFGLFENRINGTVSWYRNRSSDQLVGLPVSFVTGAGSIQSNSDATVENRGWEFELSIFNVRTEAFNWTTDFNISFPRNELISYPNLEESLDANQLRIGKSLNVFPAFQYIGIDPESGVYNFMDLNGDGQISFPEDLQFAKEVEVEYFGGLNNSLSHKNFTLQFFLEFRKQTGLNFLNNYRNPPGISENNYPSVALTRWTNPNDRTSVERLGLFSPRGYQDYVFSDAMVVDASFVCLKSISISYNLSSSVLSNLGIENLQFNLTGFNLLTFTEYDGLDPETQSISLPPLRTITAGFNLIF